MFTGSITFNGTEPLLLIWRYHCIKNSESLYSGYEQYDVYIFSTNDIRRLYRVMSTERDRQFVIVFTVQNNKTGHVRKRLEAGYVCSSVLELRKQSASTPLMPKYKNVTEDSIIGHVVDPFAESSLASDREKYTFLLLATPLNVYLFHVYHPAR